MIKFAQLSVTNMLIWKHKTHFHTLTLTGEKVQFVPGESQTPANTRVLLEIC